LTVTTCTPFDRERRGQDVLEGRPPLQALAKLAGLGGESAVLERLDGRLERVDLLQARTQLLHLAIVL